MSHHLGAILFQSLTRSSVLDLLFVHGLSASVSELARRAGLSARAVGNEVRHLRPTGLVLVESVGGADVVRANKTHSAASHLTALLQTPGTALRLGEPKVRESLAAWGAPLAGVRPVKHHALSEALMLGLEESRHDGTVLRVLPLVLSRNLDTVDWVELREESRRRKLKAELGLLVELCAQLTGKPQLSAEVAELRDRRRKGLQFLPEVKNHYEAQLAKRRSPPVARRWGFWMNMSEESFRSLLEKHGA